MSDKSKVFAAVYNDIRRFPKLKDVADQLRISIKTVKNTAGIIRSEGSVKLISRRQERDKLRAEAGELGFNPVLPGFAVASTSVTMNAEGQVQRTSVHQKKAPGERFEVPEGYGVEAMSVLKDADGRVVLQWDKVKRDRPEQVSDLVEALKSAFADYRGAAQATPAPHLSHADMLTIYPLADLHLGMLSWGKETRDPYDLDIAESRLKQMAGDLMAQSRPTEEGLILGLGDLFHMNDHKNMTPRSGHILDADGRWPKVLMAGVRLMMWMINLALQKHQRVRVRFLPGNHDPDGAIALTVALAIFYENEPRVTVDDDPSLIFYHQFGKCLIGATHGHTMKPDRMAMMMAVDKPQAWGSSLWRFFFYGHFHSEKVTQVMGTKVECVTTIASKDAHAHGGGWRSEKELTAITLHKERGQIGRHYVNLGDE